MATYYKRVEREADSQVNWAEIGKSMSDMLANENKVREEKKAAIDKASRDYAEVLANSPQGEHVGARQQALDFANNASQYMLMQDKLLKSGQLKLKDYTVTRQNLVDDTDRAFKMNAEYQKVFAEKMERSRTDKSALYELEAMERIEGFGNFSQSGMYIDPTTGKVSVAMREKQIIDGKEVYTMPENPEKRTTIDTLNGLLLGKWDKYRVNEATTEFAASIGENIQTLRTVGSRTKAGQILTVTDVLSQARQEVDINAEIASKQAQIKALEGKTDKKSIAAKAKLEGEIKSAQDELVSSKAVFDFVKFETDGINSMLANDFNRISVLTDNKKTASNGKLYRFTRNAQDAEDNPEAILMVPDPASGMEKPQFSEAQMNDSTEFMRTNLRGKYDYKETSQMVSDYQAPQQRQEWEKRYGDEQQQRQTLINAWKDLRSGNLQQKKAALEYLNGSPYLKQQGLGNLKYTNDGNSITFDYVNPQTGAVINSVTKDLVVAGQALSGADWLNSGSEAFGNLTEQERKKHSGGDYQFSEGQQELASSRQFTPQAPAPADVDVSAQVKNAFSNVDAQLFDDEQNEVTQELQAVFSPYGIKVTPSGTAGDYITITIPGVATKQFPVDATFEGGAVEYKTNIENWLNETLNKENSKTLQGVGANW
jgi:hypothetical protein